MEAATGSRDTEVHFLFVFWVALSKGVPIGRFRIGGRGEGIMHGRILHLKNTHGSAPVGNFVHWKTFRYTVLPHR